MEINTINRLEYGITDPVLVLGASTDVIHVSDIRLFSPIHIPSEII